MTDKKILIGITGSIAAYKIYDLIRVLKKDGHQVKCIVSEGGKRFINTLTIETLIEGKLYSDLFAEYDDKKAVHIPLADWADVYTIVPATADIMAKAAHGMADELLLSVLLATRAPILFAPAMHTNMWTHAMTQKNVDCLMQAGMNFVGPEEGQLSDGSKGIGHIASLESIKDAMYGLLK